MVVAAAGESIYGKFNYIKLKAFFAFIFSIFRADYKNIIMQCKRKQVFL